MNKNKPAHFVQNTSSYNSVVRKQYQTGTYHQWNHGSGNAYTHSGKSAEEYSALAQVSMGQGDRLLAEAYYQYADMPCGSEAHPKKLPQRLDLMIAVEGINFFVIIFVQHKTLYV